jgi:hypothetical protein
MCKAVLPRSSLENTVTASGSLRCLSKTFSHWSQEHKGWQSFTLVELLFKILRTSKSWEFVTCWKIYELKRWVPAYVEKTCGFWRWCNYSRSFLVSFTYSCVTLKNTSYVFITFLIVNSLPLGQACLRYTTTDLADYLPLQYKSSNLRIVVSFEWSNHTWKNTSKGDGPWVGVTYLSSSELPRANISRKDEEVSDDSRNF